MVNLGFDHLAVATTQQSNASSDDATIIASMSDRLNLLATVKNQDTDISEQIKGQINIPNIRFAASIYIACRQNGMTLSIKEISYVADGAEESKITNAVRSVVKKLGLPPQLMHIRAAEFAKRYSTNLQMDSQAVKAAEEAVERCTDHVNRVFKMWGFDDCCSRYQTSDGFVYNHVAKNPSSSSDDNLQKLGFDLDVSTTQQSNASSDDATVIASMSDRLSLRATVKYIESLNELVTNKGTNKHTQRSAASIYIACRQNGMALSIKDISSVADGAKQSKITSAVRSVVDKLGLPPQLIHIRAAEFAKRYSIDLQMNRQAIKAAEEAAERCTDHVNRSRPPSSIAAAVVYIIAQLSYEKKLLKDIKEATGVHVVNTIKGTYKDLYPHLPKIIPTWFANANDLKKLHSP
ncbi:hypothetical protein HID58_060790 [Brassica napus]|uniref:Transcription factor TFIIB cyclin-like domain-containing protein n=1 Tax=Brassica napus TaxID=3708 RepID=A0ABQ7ZWU0_BRANA|nr:hypothetical protein HID58_060790 [Brassica napus]